ncbi:MAG: hypothetical protein LBQ66_03640 [Planctomycetaceae bacterium]|nr:hypothetical protein [Planctomycetaceae bacterium]
MIFQTVIHRRSRQLPRSGAANLRGQAPRYTTQVFLRIQNIRKIQNKRKELMVKFRLFRIFCLFRIL